MRFMKGCMFQTRLVNNNGAATMRCIFGFIMSNNRLKKKTKNKNQTRINQKHPQWKRVRGRQRACAMNAMRLFCSANPA